jgi:hypothetical protein
MIYVVGTNNHPHRFVHRQRCAGAETTETKTGSAGRLRHTGRRAGPACSSRVRHDADHRAECALVWRSSHNADQERRRQEVTIITHRHCRELGYCNRGMRQWCGRLGLDWCAFLQNGIASDELRKTDNAMAERVIAHAEREINGQQ